MKALKQGILDVLDLFFPPLCVCCGNRLITQEKYVCFSCWEDLPVTNFHLNKDNKVAQLFWGRTTIENASSFFAFKKGSRYQQILHYTKYKGLKELGFESGKKLGFALQQSKGFREVDLIVPVPLHPRKQKSRGYNQSFWIAKGLAEILGKPLSKGNLYRSSYTSTQTRKNRFERWMNVEGIFQINDPHEFESRHILLVDDVVTTGSTLEACAFPLLQVAGTKVSIATLAYADI